MRHPLESRSTRSSRSKTSAVWLLALVAGCATPGEVSVTPEGTSEVVAKLQSIGFEEKLMADDFALTYGKNNFYLGGEKKDALAAFEPLDRSIEFTSLPNQFDEERFGAFGWETGDFAFGCITFEQTDTETMLKKDVVVQAMYTRDDVDEDTIQAVQKLYKEAYGEPLSSLPGNRIGYWFWSKPGRRLMVSTAVTATGKKSLTVAIGETQVMTLLGMSYEQAKADKDKAIQRLNQASSP